MADANKINLIETKNITKVSGVEGKNITRLGNFPVSFAQIPAGLIVFYNDTSIPENWERFTAADDRMIIGAGNSYSIGNNGGSDTVNLNINTGSAGSHSHTVHGTVNFPTNAAQGGSLSFLPPWYALSFIMKEA